MALPSVEPLAIVRPQGIKAKIFYTAYQGNIYGIAVPADSPVQKFTDLKGKTIGVTNMASAGVLIARALARRRHGMNPDSDVTIVVAGEGAQTAAHGPQQAGGRPEPVRHAVRAGRERGRQAAPARHAGHRPLSRPTASWRSRRRSRTGARRWWRSSPGYAKGTVFAIANPEAAVRILYEVFPADEAHRQGRGDGGPRRRQGARGAHRQHWKLEKAGVKRWGENSEANYRDYVDFMLKWGVIKQKVDSARSHHQRADRRHQPASTRPRSRPRPRAYKAK